MKIFISWSGEKARRIALELKALLEGVNQRIEAWFSEEDITAGQRWGFELASQLESTDYGIICVTQESLKSHWVIFEAGALSKAVKNAKVCPYLIDLDRKQLTGPLSQFQAKEANKEQTWHMLQSINSSMGSDALAEGKLKRNFDAFWSSLFDEITKVNNELKSDIIINELEFFETSGELNPKQWLKLLGNTNRMFDIMGISLKSWIQTDGFEDEALKKAEIGCKIRILMMHEEHESLSELTSNLEGTQADIRQFYQDYLSLSKKNSNIEVRLIKKGVPHLNLTITDQSAVMIQYMKSKKFGGGPLWECINTSTLYNILKAEFETLWNMSNNAATNN